ncbi:unnamed protein product [Adineta steineri]|uniref:RxLR effector protein n=1 Tax=Adineta steineri TaxID=433720 RepID=A0A814PBW6_9BILA|nr:unnamed protein product [Adineta steineri]
MHGKAVTVCFTVVIFVLVTVCSGRSIKDDLTPANLHRRRTGSISQTKNQADQHHNTAGKRDDLQDYLSSSQGQALLSNPDLNAYLAQLNAAKRDNLKDYLSSAEGQALLSNPDINAALAKYQGSKRYTEVDKRDDLKDYLSSAEGQALLSNPDINAYLAQYKGAKRVMIH